MAVYLLHFQRPITEGHPCQHYIGYADDVEARMRLHERGRGCNLARVAAERGISFVVAKVWPDGDRTFERKLKNRKEAPRPCPICREEKSVSRETSNSYESNTAA